MFREMRRNRQFLPQDESVAILNRGTSGVLAVAGDDDYPYTVPISYVFADEKLYFHCAQSGHKLDAIQRSPKASFCVIDRDQIVPEKYTTFFRSVIAFGRVRILEDDQEKRAAIEKLAVKYSPSESEASRQQEIEREWKPLCMLEMTIDHMTGKEAIELVKERQVEEPNTPG